MKLYRYENTKEEVNKAQGPIIFLAGPTVRGNQQHLVSWRHRAIEIFQELKFQGSLIVPEFISKSESDKGKKEIPLWEYNGLKKADIILFWIPRTKELIGLTTNWELGYWFARDPNKLVLGFPELGSPNSYRNEYIATMFEKITQETNSNSIIHNTLEDTIKMAIYKASL